MTGLLPPFVGDTFFNRISRSRRGRGWGGMWAPAVRQGDAFRKKRVVPEPSSGIVSRAQGTRILKADQEKGVFMRITNRGRYALRASLALARLGKDGLPVSINNLAEQENISSVFLEQIFFRLRKAGIVTSVRGPGGGFYFAQPLDKLTIKAILDAAGEDLDLNNCDKSREDCERLGFCLTHSIWREVTDLVNNYFRNITIASILDKTAMELGEKI
jgi:Rrf2 family iron-sulfur cluster assembly transcriptional regulator